jgi:type II secretory pathway predicted ATPase ExeA
MELAAAGLQEQPFRTHGKSLVYVAYAAQESATRFLKDTVEHAHGLGLFQGPRLSGKSTIIREFVETIDRDTAFAVVDGAGLNTTSFLTSVLGQFGYELQVSSANELINMLRVFAMQQAGSGRPPLLIVENTHAMNPSALRMLCELAEFRLRRKSALKMVLASDRSIEAIVSAPAMESIASRLTGNFFLDPMSADETRDYLHAKLRAGGCISPEGVVPDDVCEQLHVFRRMAGRSRPARVTGIGERDLLIRTSMSATCCREHGRQSCGTPCGGAHCLCRTAAAVPDIAWQDIGRKSIWSDRG